MSAQKINKPTRFEIFNNRTVNILDHIANINLLFDMAKCESLGAAFDILEEYCEAQNISTDLFHIKDKPCYFYVTIAR